MKIQIASDVHFEFFSGKHHILSWLEELYTDADVLILAGDVWSSSPRILKSFFPVMAEIASHYKEVIYVLGNHEFYHGYVDDTIGMISSQCDLISNLHLLNNESIEIAGKKIFGGTMWFPKSKQTDLYSSFLNDFSQIRGFKDYFPNSNIEFISKCMRANPDIVVSHHLPHEDSVASDFKSEPTNCFYVADNAIEVLDSVQPELWIHGHTHSSCDYEIDCTRVICNPFGYHGYEKNLGFELNKVIEL